MGIEQSSSGYTSEHKPTNIAETEQNGTLPILPKTFETPTTNTIFIIHKLLLPSQIPLPTQECQQQPLLSSSINKNVTTQTDIHHRRSFHQENPLYNLLIEQRHILPNNICEILNYRHGLNEDRVQHTVAETAVLTGKHRSKVAHLEHDGYAIIDYRNGNKQADIPPKYKQWIDETNGDIPFEVYQENRTQQGKNTHEQTRRIIDDETLVGYENLPQMFRRVTELTKGVTQAGKFTSKETATILSITVKTVSQYNYQAYELLLYIHGDKSAVVAPYHKQWVDDCGGSIPFDEWAETHPLVKRIEKKTLNADPKFLEIDPELLKMWNILPKILQKTVDPWYGLSDGIKHTPEEIAFLNDNTNPKVILKRRLEARSILLYIHGDLDAVIKVKYKKWIDAWRKHLETPLVPYDDYRKALLAEKQITHIKRERAPKVSTERHGFVKDSRLLDPVLLSFSKYLPKKYNNFINLRTEYMNGKLRTTKEMSAALHCGHAHVFRLQERSLNLLELLNGKTDIKPAKQYVDWLDYCKIQKFLISYEDYIKLFPPHKKEHIPHPRIVRPKKKDSLDSMPKENVSHIVKAHTASNHDKEQTPQINTTFPSIKNVIPVKSQEPEIPQTYKPRTELIIKPIVKMPFDNSRTPFDVTADPTDDLAMFEQDIKSYTRLTHEEEQGLLARVAKDRVINSDGKRKIVKLTPDGLRARETLVLSNQLLVMSRVKYYMYRGLSPNELINCGNIGLMRAIDLFIPDGKRSLSTYAVRWINQKMSRATRNTGQTIRHPVHYGDWLSHKIKIENMLKQFLLRNPTDEEIAEKLNMTVERYRIRIQDAKSTVSLNVPIDDSDDTELGDILPADGLSVEQTVTQNYDKELIEQLLRMYLTPKQERFMRLFFGFKDGYAYTVKEISEISHVSRQNVNQTISAAIEKLKQIIHRSNF